MGELSFSNHLIDAWSEISVGLLAYGSWFQVHEVDVGAVLILPKVLLQLFAGVKFQVKGLRIRGKGYGLRVWGLE